MAGGGRAMGWLMSLILVPVLAVGAGAFKHVKDKHWTDRYDQHFRKYSKHYFGAGFDWHWFKAQAIAESNLEPRVRSTAGARGIMQILPSTFAEIKKKNPHFRNIEEPKWNIAAGIYYDRQLFRKWNKGVPRAQRLSFAFASYNAGYVKVRRAFRKAARDKDQVSEWEQVAPFAPSQTRHYVRRIKSLMRVDT